MRLPNRDRAEIDRAKLVDYCLDPTHPRGKHKARVFASVLGLTRDDADVLLVALQRAALDGEAIAGERDAWGERWEIDFTMSHGDRTTTVRSAWIIRTGEDVPRLVTCYIP